MQLSNFPLLQERPSQHWLLVILNLSWYLFHIDKLSRLPFLLLFCCLNRSQCSTSEMDKHWVYFLLDILQRLTCNSVKSNTICVRLSTSCHVFIWRAPAKKERSLVEEILLTMKRVCFTEHFHTQYQSLNVCPPPLCSFPSQMHISKEKLTAN